QARAAELVKAPGGRLLGDAGGHGRLARRILALRGGQYLAKNHLVDLPGIDACTGQRFPDGDGAEFVRGRVGESSVEGADRGAGGAGDDDGSGHDLLQTVGGAWEAPWIQRHFSRVSTGRVKPEIGSPAAPRRRLKLCCEA